MALFAGNASYNMVLVAFGYMDDNPNFHTTRVQGKVSGSEKRKSVVALILKIRHHLCILLGGSGGFGKLAKKVNNGDKQGYYMAYRSY